MSLLLQLSIQIIPTMSTWHDLIDDNSVRDFIGDDDTSSSSNNGRPDVTEPPVPDNLLDTELVEAEEETSLGLTIVPSVPTDNLSLNTGDVSDVDLIEDVEESSSSSSSVPLSLNPSSVASSVMTEWSESSLSCVDSECGSEQTPASQDISCDKQQVVYEQLTNETEWHIFRENAMKVLNSLENIEEKEMLMAEIVAMEQQYFFEKPKPKAIAKTWWLEIGAIAVKLLKASR